jgi:diguanylate cyclase (GGDEF)-like protein
MDEAEIFHQLSRALASIDSLPDLLQTIVDSLRQPFQADPIAIVLFDLPNSRISNLVASGGNASELEILSFDEWLHRLGNWTSEEPPGQQDSHWSLAPQTTLNPPGHPTAQLNIPLIYQERLLGMILTARPADQDPFTRAEYNLLTSLANQIALAVENARLSSIEHQQRKQAETLREVTRILNSSLDQQHLLELILDQLARVVEYDSASIMMVAGENLPIVASRKFRIPEQSGMVFRIDSLRHIQEAFERRLPVIIPDTENDPGWQKLPHSNYIRCWLGVPLIGKDQVIGLLNLDKAQPGYYTQEEASLAAVFANQATTAIENARLYESACQAADRRAILHQVSQKIVTVSLEPESIYQAIHQAAAQLMPAEAFAITQYDEQEQVHRAVYLIDCSGRAPQQTTPANRGLSGRILASGQSIYIQDTRDENKLGDVVHFGDPDEVRSVVAVPMRLRGQVTGMLSAQCYQPNAYTEEDLALLEMLASYAAIALDNARLFIHTQQLAITDPLTEIINRRHLFDSGQREYNRARRFGRPLSVIMIDIDHFKQVNDGYGHAAGDEVLYRLAQFVKSNIRDIDLLGRYGGEEFTIILPETELEAAFVTAERLRKGLPENFRQFSLQTASDEGPTTITASIGVATLDGDTPSFSAIVNHADAALYQAKNNGRNRVEIYPASGKPT